jgi:hypothetical protein
MERGFIDPNSPYAQALYEAMMEQGGDLGTEEDKFRQQLLQANQLRVTPQANRMDWASQAGRAIQGIGSGYLNYKGQQGQQAQGKKLLDVYRNAEERMRRQRGGGMSSMGEFSPFSGSGELERY